MYLITQLPSNDCWVIHICRPNLEMNPRRRLPGTGHGRPDALRRPQSIGAGVETSAVNASAGVRQTHTDCQSARPAHCMGARPPLPCKVDARGVAKSLSRSFRAPIHAGGKKGVGPDLLHKPHCLQCIHVYNKENWSQRTWAAEYQRLPLKYACGAGCFFHCRTRFKWTWRYNWPVKYDLDVFIDCIFQNTSAN